MPRFPPPIWIGRSAGNQEKLGLTPVREVADAGVMYQVGEGSGFFLYPTSNAGKAPNTLMSFSAEDIVADVAALKKRGVVFEEYDFPGLKTVDGIADMGPVRSAWFKDSEGNLAGLVQLPAGSS